jgi:hypothetical protein
MNYYFVGFFRGLVNMNMNMNMNISIFHYILYSTTIIPEKIFVLYGTFSFKTFLTNIDTIFRSHSSFS